MDKHPTQYHIDLYRSYARCEQYYARKAIVQPSFRAVARQLAQKYRQVLDALLEEYGEAVRPVPTVHDYEDYPETEPGPPQVELIPPFLPLPHPSGATPGSLGPHSV